MEVGACPCRDPPSTEGSPRLRPLYSGGIYIDPEAVHDPSSSEQEARLPVLPTQDKPRPHRRQIPSVDDEKARRQMLVVPVQGPDPQISLQGLRSGRASRRPSGPTALEETRSTRAVGKDGRAHRWRRRKKKWAVRPQSGRTRARGAPRIRGGGRGEVGWGGLGGQFVSISFFLGRRLLPVSFP